MLIRGVDLIWQRAGSPADGAISAAPSLPLIWGHGLTSSRADEDVLGVLDFAGLSDIDVIRYDARGHGESGFTTVAAEYAWDQMALDQLALTTELGVDTYVSGGASLGAATALHAAVAAPDRIVGLVLVIPPTGWETRAAQTDTYEQMAQIIDAKGVKALMAAPALSPPAPLAGRDDWAQRRLSRLAAADPVRLAGLFRGARVADLPPRDVVSTVTAPTLVLAWEGDPGHPVSTAEELGALMPNAATHVASTWDEFSAWTPMVHDFIASL